MNPQPLAQSRQLILSVYVAPLPKFVCLLSNNLITISDVIHISAHTFMQHITSIPCELTSLFHFLHLISIRSFLSLFPLVFFLFSLVSLFLSSFHFFLPSYFTFYVFISFSLPQFQLKIISQTLLIVKHGEWRIYYMALIRKAL